MVTTTVFLASLCDNYEKINNHFFFSLSLSLSFSHSCTSRYTGEFCESTNPCYNGSGPRCQNGGTCEVTSRDGVPSFVCRCAIGFTASLCEIPVKNACDSSPCNNGGSCKLKTLDDYSCLCAIGYSGKCPVVLKREPDSGLQILSHSDFDFGISIGCCYNIQLLVEITSNFLDSRSSFSEFTNFNSDFDFISSKRPNSDSNFSTLIIASTLTPNLY